MKLLRYHLCFLGFACFAYGTVIYSDFNPTNVTYQGGWGIYGTSNDLFPGAFNSMAMAFTPVFEASLTSIDVAISWSSGTNSVVLTLDSDNSGVPGGVIASWTLNNLPSFGFCCTAETVMAASPIPLGAGTRYWVTAAPGTSDTRAIWTNTNTLGLLADQQTLGGPFIPGNSTLSAFDVNGIVVPEPSSFVLVAASLALLAGSRLVSDSRFGTGRRVFATQRNKSVECFRD
jgi:hypothetical protein